MLKLRSNAKLWTDKNSIYSFVIVFSLSTESSWKDTKEIYWCSHNNKQHFETGQTTSSFLNPSHVPLLLPKKQHFLYRDEGQQIKLFTLWCTEFSTDTLNISTPMQSYYNLNDVMVFMELLGLIFFTSRNLSTQLVLLLKRTYVWFLPAILLDSVSKKNAMLKCYLGCEVFTGCGVF